MIGCKRFVSLSICTFSCFTIALTMSEMMSGFQNSTEWLDGFNASSSEINGGQIDRKTVGEIKRRDASDSVSVSDSRYRNTSTDTAHIGDSKSTSGFSSSLDNGKVEFICDHNLSEITMLPEDKCLEEKAKGGFFCLDVPDSCNGFCGQSFSIRCSCDIHCEIYDACCNDFRTECPNVWKESLEKFGNLLDTHVQCLDFVPGYFVIASCPKGTTLRADKEMCEDVHDISFLPVSVGHFHFKNIHCLICNGFDKSDSKNWRILLKFPLGEKDTEYALNRGGMNTLDMIMDKSKQTLKPPSQKSLHMCSKDVISSCPESGSIDIRDKCHSGKSNVAVVENSIHTVYKNRHCAECNVASKYVCVLVKQKDYEKTWTRSFRFSAILAIIADLEKEDSFIVTAPRPFRWEAIRCERLGLNRTCTLIKCRDHYEHDMDSCISVPNFCATVRLSWSGQCKTDSNCNETIGKIVNGIRLSPNEKSLNIISADAYMSLLIFHIDTNFRLDSSIDTIYNWLVTIVSKWFSAYGFNGWFSICIGQCKNKTECVRFNETTGPINVLSSQSTAPKAGYLLSGILSYFCFVITLLYY